MSSICYATNALFPGQSFADWPLEVWARATSDAAAGHEVVVVWLIPGRNADSDLETPRRLYRERGVELVPTSDLAPYLAADEAFGREPGLRLLPALRKLHGERKFDRIELPAGDGFSLRVIQAAAASSDFDEAAVTVHLGKFGEWQRFRQRRLSLTRDEVKRDFMERESVEIAPRVRSASLALTGFAREIGWDVGHVLPDDPADFFVTDSPRHASPQMPCFLGDAEEVLDTLLRAVVAKSPVRRWLAAFAERLDENARGRVNQAVRAGTSEIEVLGARRWDLLPAALRERGAIVILTSGLADARLRWLAAEKVAFVFAEGTPGLEEFAALSFEPGDLVSLLSALEAARRFADWDRLFQAVCQRASEKSSPVEVVAAPAYPAPADRVLIAVSHYNLGVLMAETLEALADQDYSACDVLVVDDGSTDALALDAFRGMKDDFPRFNFVELPHAGYWSPRNFAIRECTAPYIIIVDGDNLPVPRMASRFVEAITRNPDRAAFSSYVSAFRETREAARAGQFNGVHAPLGGDIVSGLFENVYGDTNSIFRIETIRAIGGFRENFRCSFGDWEIFHRLVGAGFGLGVVPEVLLHYRRRERGMIRQSPLYPNYFELFRTSVPGPAVRPADWRRMNHALHGLSLPR